MKAKKRKIRSAKSSKGAMKGYPYRTQPNAYSMDPVVKFYRSIGVRSQ